MTTPTIDSLRAAFKKNENEGTSRPNNYYPFWNIPEGSQAVIRFLPDANEDNPMQFLVEKLMHTLTINGENKSIPCLKMYDEDCPICKVSSAYYKEEDKVNGKKYWRKKQHLAQVLVVEDSLPADDSGESHEGKVRFVALGYQIFNIIKDTFESGELEEVPFAYEDGTNFIIKKTKQGDYPSYSLSKFARKSTDLTEDEYSLVVDQLIDLSTLIPPNPGIEKVEAMLEAALTGGSFEEDSSKSEPEKKSPMKKPSFAKKDKAEAKEEAPAKEESIDDDEFNADSEADKIIQQIRARNAKKA